jgi:hypothetical protein
MMTVAARVGRANKDLLEKRRIVRPRKFVVSLSV